MDKKQGKLVKMGEEKPDMVFNKVWEVTQMTWPEPIPEKNGQNQGEANSC